MTGQKSVLKTHACLAGARVRSWAQIADSLREEIVFETPIQLNLMRHAQSESNAAKLVTGSRDVELSMEGREQAIRLGRFLHSHYDLAFCSRLKRSRETLTLALEAGNVQVDAVYMDARLNERGLGVLEGQPSRHIPQYEAGDLGWAPEGGESYLSVAQRILSFLLDLAEVQQTEGLEEVLISSHIGTMRILVGILGGFSNPTDVFRLTFPNARIVELVWGRLGLPTFLKNVV